ncbi:MAG: hypothetical protein QXI35_07270 [Candidatus Nezhaarchaeales archaeon]
MLGKGLTALRMEAHNILPRAKTTPRLQAFVAKLILDHSYGIYLSYLAKVASKALPSLSKTALHHGIRRLLQSWREKGLIRLKKLDGFVFIQLCNLTFKRIPDHDNCRDNIERKIANIQYYNITTSEDLLKNTIEPMVDLKHW